MDSGGGGLTLPNSNEPLNFDFTTLHDFLIDPNHSSLQDLTNLSDDDHSDQSNKATYDLDAEKVEPLHQSSMNGDADRSQPSSNHIGKDHLGDILKTMYSPHQMAFQNFSPGISEDLLRANSSALVDINGQPFHSSLPNHAPANQMMTSSQADYRSYPPSAPSNSGPIHHPGTGDSSMTSESWDEGQVCQFVSVGQAPSVLISSRPP